MNDLTIASFEVKNPIGADQEYYQFQSYIPEECTSKRDFLADQMVTLDADIVGFQEVFDKLSYGNYRDAQIAFAPNVNAGEAGHSRPGVAILSQFGFADAAEISQNFDQPLDIPFSDRAEDGEYFRISRLSRSILKLRVPVGQEVITVFNCYLKSKWEKLKRFSTGGFAPQTDLKQYDPVGRAFGSARAAMRRMGEAWGFRGTIVRALNAGNPVMVLGDFSDAENAASSEIISGERPAKNDKLMLRHDAQHRGDYYSEAKAIEITEDVKAVRLQADEKLFVRKSLRDMVYTAAFGGIYESIDQIYMSRLFLTKYANSISEMKYLSTFNDHLTNSSQAEAPCNKLASDHGQIMAP